LNFFEILIQNFLQIDCTFYYEIKLKNNLNVWRIVNVFAVTFYDRLIVSLICAYADLIKQYIVLGLCGLRWLEFSAIFHT